jgi:hypothetical protein
MSNNKQIKKYLELPHRETVISTNTIQTKPFDNQKEMSNNKQTAVDSIIEFCHKQMDNDSSIHKGVYLSIIKFCEEQITEESEIHWKTTLVTTKAMEMSYADAYEEGYKGALEFITQWAISNLTPPHNEQQ